MKTIHTDEQLQAAIDEALLNTHLISLATRRTSRYWEQERPARLTLARALLARLPEPTPPAQAPAVAADPYAELKAAHAAGRAIQYQVFKEGSWIDCDEPGFYDDHNYRTKPEPKTIPLDINDIRATDEFRLIESSLVKTVTEWNQSFVWLSGSQRLSYESLAAECLRRQHGSNEWKPCTKQISANQH